MENITNVRSKILSFFSNKEDVRLATISDVNHVIDKFNNVFPYRMFDIDLTQSGTDAPELRRLASGAAECTHVCSAGTSTSCACDCIKGCSNEGSRFASSLVYIGVGIYDLTITLDPKYFPRPIKNVGFFLGSHSEDAKLSFIQQRLEVGSPNIVKYRISVKDSSDVLANDVLNNTIIAMKIYF